MTVLNILCGNYSGISARETSTRILNLIRKHKPSLVCPIGTKANNVRLNCFCSNIFMSWDWAAILAEGFSGGIITLWNRNIGYVTPIAASRRALDLIISPDNLTHYIVFVIYNSNSLHVQCSLWQELACISSLSYP